MVTAGQWRITKPEVKGHAGFRLNALVSLVPNATWSQLAQEFVEAKGDPEQLQTFVNTLLAEGWSTPSMVNEDALAARAEPFDLDHIPKEVLVLTAGGDVQDDRIEATICGWTRNSECLVLGHSVIWGSFADQGTWDEMDELLRTKWRHPFGGRLKIDAAVMDAGDGDHYDSVMNFCVPKLSRRVFAGKGLFGARPGFAMAKGKRIGGRLALIGVDTIKNVIFDRLQRGRGIRFSKSLESVYFEQLASERRVIRYSRGQPVRRFERTGRTRAEALDCLTYAYAARQSIKGMIVARRSCGAWTSRGGQLRVCWCIKGNRTPLWRQAFHSSTPGTAATLSSALVSGSFSSPRGDRSSLSRRGGRSANEDAARLA
jgi:phage terminase large subunit GpA-like protein